MFSMGTTKDDKIDKDRIPFEGLKESELKEIEKELAAVLTPEN
jgi:hypothetical protein